MENFDCLIIGGGIAGTTAAETYRRNNPEATILILNKEPEFLYSRVLLFQLLKHEMTEEQVFMRKEQEYLDKKIQIRTGVTVTKIDTTAKIVTTDKGEIGYQKLLIASGGIPRKLGVIGEDLNGIFYWRSIFDSRQIDSYVAGKKTAGVVGGGFIGLELVQAFIKFGLETYFFILEDWFWQNMLGEESGKLLDQILSRNGVKMLYNVSVDHFEGEGRLERSVLKNGQSIATDLCGIGIGIVPETEFVGEEIKKNKGKIITDEYLKTSIADVWAAGDITEFWDTNLKMPVNYGTWVNASEQGRTAGENMSGNARPFKLIAAYSAPVFDANLTTVGVVRRDLAQQIEVLGSASEGSVAEILISGGKVLGATLVNAQSMRGKITQMIESGETFDRAKLV